MNSELLLRRRSFLGWTAALVAVAASPVFVRPALAATGTVIGRGGDLNAAIAALPNGWTLESASDARWWLDRPLQVVGGSKAANMRGAVVEMRQDCPAVHVHAGADFDLSNAYFEYMRAPGKPTFVSIGLMKARPRGVEFPKGALAA